MSTIRRHEQSQSFSRPVNRIDIITDNIFNADAVQVIFLSVNVRLTAAGAASSASNFSSEITF